MRTFALGDVHGEITQLETVFLKSGFNFNEDRLIFLGDVVDRGEQPFDCIDLLLSVKNLVPIAGNHDLSFLDYINTGDDLFKGHHGSIVTKFMWDLLTPTDQDHYKQNYFYKMRPYFIFNNTVFVHGGFDTNKPIAEQDIKSLVWDRELWQTAMQSTTDIKAVDGFNKIYIGHTPTTYYDQTYPMYEAGVWNLDTGCGKDGLLTIMDVKTNDFWQA